MSRDFRSDRIRVFKIIGSGSSGSAGPGLAIYSASSANPSYLPGEGDSTMFQNVGSDVFLFVSGTNSGGSVKRGTLGASVSLFGGDVVVSGTLWAERQVIEVEEATTGSLTVSGSLMVSQSVTIKGYKKEGAGGYNHVAIHFANNDTTNVSRIVWDEAHAAIWEQQERFYINASGSVLVLSGGAPASNNEALATDVAFYVSGTKGASAAGVKGVSLFGGDVTVSGSHRVQQDAKINVDKGSADFIHFGSSVGKEMISSLASLGQVLILSGGAPASANEATYTDVAVFVSGTKLSKGTSTKGTALFGGDIYVSGGVYLGSRIYSDGDVNTSIRPQTNRWRIIANNFEHVDFNSSIAQKLTAFNRGKENIDFQVSSDNKLTAIFVDASTDQVLILSGGAATSNNEATGLDVNLYTSGTVGSKGTSVRGTALFGGDVHISGSITSDGTALVNGTGAAAEIAYWTDSDTITSDNDLTFDGTTLTVNKSLIVNESSGQFDFKVKTKDRDYAIFTKGANNQVLILSGGTSGNSPNESNYTDMALFVSGAIGARGTSTKGVSLFGGDTVISGSLTAINGSKSGGTISGSIHHTDGGVSYIVGGTNVTVASSSNGQLTISSTGGEWTRATVPNRVYPIGAASTHVLVGGTSLGAANIILASDGGATFNEPGDSVDFRVESNTKENALLVDGSTDQVLILSGGVPTDAFNEAAGADINFYVSGTVGSKGTSVRGTTLFGGDLAASGTIYASEYIRHDGDNDTFIRLRDNAIQLTAGNTNVFNFAAAENTISLNGDNAAVSTIINTTNKLALAISNATDQVLILSGGAAASFNEAAAADVSFYVSGSRGLRGTSVRGTSVFGGDLVASGTLRVSGSIADLYNPNAGIEFSTGHVNNFRITAADNKEIIGRAADGTPDTIIINNDAAQLSFLVKTNNKWAIVSKAETSTTNTVYINTDTSGEAGTDTAMWVSGSKNSKGTTTKGTSVFGGDVVISGSLYGGSPLSIGGDLVVSGAVIFSGSSETTVTGSMVMTGSMTVTGSLTVSGSDTFTVYGPSIFNEGGTSDSDFRVESDNKTHAVFVDASTDQVLILSGGAPASSNESSYTDINFFVSGSKDSKGTSTKGTSVFGGDVVSSGTMYISGTIKVVDDADSYIEFHHNHANSARFVAGGVQIISRDAAGTPDAITINSDGAAVSALWKVNNKFAFGSKHATNQVFINSDTATEGGADTSFWVSGSIGSATTSTRGTSVFGGDVVLSGALHVEEYIRHSGDTDTNISLGTNRIALTAGDDTFLSYATSDATVFYGESVASSPNHVFRTTGQPVVLGLSDTQVLILSGGAGGSFNEGAAADVAFYVSGTVGSAGTSTRGASIFGGDVVISGSLSGGSPLQIGGYRTDLGTDVKNLFVANTGGNSVVVFDGDVLSSGSIRARNKVIGDLGLSGSLTKLADGTSYLIAGSGITIASASNGAVTITGTAVSAEWTDEGSVLRPNDGAAEDVGVGGTGTSEGNYKFYVDGATGNTKTLGFVTASLGFSGSLTKLTDGTSYLIAGSGINIASASNGAVTITGTATSAEWTDQGTILRPNDGAADNVGIGSTGTNSATYKIFLSGSGDIKTNTIVTASLGFSGSLTRLTNGTSYLVAGSNVTITSASNGQVTIASSGGGTPGGLNTQVQYNNSSNFGGISGVTTNGSVMTFGDSAILVGQDITHDGDSDTFMRFEPDQITFSAGNQTLLTLKEHTQDVVTVGPGGGDVDFQVSGSADDNALFVQGSSGRVGMGTNAPSTILHVKESAPTVTIQRESNANNSTLQFMGQAGATANMVHMATTNDLVFSTHDGSDQEEILRLGSHYGVDVRQVIMLSGSGMAASSMQPKQSTDINFFVSGAIGSRATAQRGTAVFGGDVVTSGSIYVGGGSSGTRSLNVYANVSGEYAAKIDNDNASSGHVLKLETDGNGSNSRLLEMEDGDGDTIFRARADGRFGFGPSGVSSMGAGTFVVGIDGGHTADIAISKRLQHLGDSNTYVEFPALDQIQLVAGDRNMINMIESGANTQILILSGGAPASPDDAKASDVAFYVSGSRTKIGTAAANNTGRNSGSRTNAVFGGDVVVSGSIYGTSEISAGNPGLHLQASTLQIAAQAQAAITDTAGVAPGFGTSQSGDTFFSVSGSMGSAGTSTRGTSVFGGDVVISGSLRGRQLHMTTHKFTPGSDARAYVRFDANGSDASPGANNKMVTPYSGRLIKVIARSTANSPVAGNTTIGLHIGTDGSTNVGTSYQGTSQTVNMASRDTAYTFNFTLAENWAGGDIVGLSMDPTETPGDVILTAVWEFETY